MGSKRGLKSREMVPKMVPNGSKLTPFLDPPEIGCSGKSKFRAVNTRVEPSRAKNGKKGVQKVVQNGVWDPIWDPPGGCQKRPKWRFCQKRCFWHFPEIRSKRCPELRHEMTLSEPQNPKMVKNRLPSTVRFTDLTPFWPKSGPRPHFDPIFGPP